MAEPDDDWLMRWAAFTYVEELSTRFGDVLPWKPSLRASTSAADGSL
jgi:hypothetical protein